MWCCLIWTLQDYFRACKWSSKDLLKLMFQQIYLTSDKTCLFSKDPFGDSCYDNYDYYYILVTKNGYPKLRSCLLRRMYVFPQS